MRFLLILSYFIMLVFCIQEKTTCPNLQKFQYDEWDAKLMCPNPLAPLIENSNLPNKKCSRFNPTMEKKNSRLSEAEKAELREKMKAKQNEQKSNDSYELYKKQKQNKKEDL